jgi:hypothetical protein
MPEIATEMFYILLQFFTTTCFGPYGPSSRGIQHQLSFYGDLDDDDDDDDDVFHLRMARRGRNMLW